MLNYIEILQPSFVETIHTGVSIQLLLRPLEIYEIPLKKPIDKIFSKNFQQNSSLTLTNNLDYLYKSYQPIKKHNSVQLVNDSLYINMMNSSAKNQNFNFDIKVNLKKDFVNLIKSEKLNLAHYIPSSLKYTNICLSLIVKNKQFVNSYTTLGYLQIIADRSLEIVKLKSKKKSKKTNFFNF